MHCKNWWFYQSQYFWHLFGPIAPIWSNSIHCHCNVFFFSPKGNRLFFFWQSMVFFHLLAPCTFFLLFKFAFYALLQIVRWSIANFMLHNWKILNPQKIAVDMNTFLQESEGDFSVLKRVSKLMRFWNLFLDMEFFWKTKNLLKIFAQKLN